MHMHRSHLWCEVWVVQAGWDQGCSVKATQLARRHGAEGERMCVSV